MIRRAVISGLQPFVANRVYTVRHGLAKGLKRRGGLGFLPYTGAPSPEERFLDQLALDNAVVWDVGGYEGVFTLFFARRVGAKGSVVTFEPNPASRARIAENVRLNGFTHVTISALALGRTPGRESLVFPEGEAARGSLLGDIQEQIRGEKRVGTLDVDVDTVDHVIARGALVPQLVKLDVEGFEYDVLEGMTGLVAGHHPRLYIELHGSTPARKLENATRVIEYLWRTGYNIFHVESARTVARAEHITSVTEGHLYCS